MKQIIIGLAGNPNSGKTTIFNALTGSHQKVGNYAGVTVEKKEGKRIHNGCECVIYDLPGTYSLTAYSIDEVIARDFIIDEKPDVIIDVLDSTNIERNLYLCLQFQELNIPVIGALNIIDQAEEMGIRIDALQLSKILGIPMCKTVGSKEKGITELLDEAIRVAEGRISSDRIPSYGEEVEREIRLLVTEIERDPEFSLRFPSRWLSIKLLEKDENAYQKVEASENAESIKKIAGECIKRIETHFGRDCEIVVSEQRYAYIHGTAKETIERLPVKATSTERIDGILLNRFLGLPVFLLILWAIFQATFIVGAYPQAWLESLFGFIAGLVDGLIPKGLLNSLIVDGVIAGFGNVFSFIPLVIILFVFISILEDTGYMARAAFIMDKFLHVFGLHGQSFLPMLIGFGCSVPAIMASRSLKSKKDRIVTVLITPLMNCGAKLPVHIVLAGAFFSGSAGNVVFSIYIAGILLAFLSALAIRKIVLKGESTPFVMELPPYRLPTVNGILWHVWDKSKLYFKKAGTVILAASVIVWVVTSFPKPEADEARYRLDEQTQRANNTDEVRKKLELYVSGKGESAGVKAAFEHGLYEESAARILGWQSTMEDETEALSAALSRRYVENLKARESLEYSIAGRVGKLVEPAIAPLGFDWKIGIATVTGFAAKEIVVSTLGTLYSIGSADGEGSESLKAALKSDPVFNPLVAYVLMLFVLILAPCFAAQATIKAELGWRWLGFFYLYSTALAWGICFAVYQAGRLLGIGV